MGNFMDDNRIVHGTILESVGLIEIEELCYTVFAADVVRQKRSTVANGDCDILGARQEMCVVHLSTIPKLNVNLVPWDTSLPKVIMLEIGRSFCETIAIGEVVHHIGDVKDVSNGGINVAG